MKVYVESNFVLELALHQEQWSSCDRILNLCEANVIRLIVPGYCLAEPYETLVRRKKRRMQLREDVEGEFKQIARTELYEDRLNGFRELASFLINSAEEEDSRLFVVSSRLLQSAEVISLDASVLLVSTQYRDRLGLSPQDAIVYASVLSHLQSEGVSASCFLNRDKDFGDDDIVKELSSYGCQLIQSFDRGCRFIVDEIN